MARSARWAPTACLEGLSLADLVERYAPVPPPRTAHILRQACASLWEAHSCELVRRNIKLQNIMLCTVRGERDFVKVLDFGLVKQISGERTHDFTGVMRILGTPLYMSPDRIRNPADADDRADRPLPGKEPGGATAKHRRSRRGARCAAGAQAMDARPAQCSAEAKLGRRGRSGATFYSPTS